MKQVKLPDDLIKSIDCLKKEYGYDRLYKIEWIMSHYKSRKFALQSIGNAIDNVVEFIKADDKNRILYFKALVIGYENDRVKNELFDTLDSNCRLYFMPFVVND